MPSSARLRRLPLLLLLLPPALLLPGLAAFPYPPTPGAFSDLTISHYPAAVFLQRALLEGGRLPLWSSTILSGAPLAANPLSGLWYPPGWLALLLPLPLGFNLLVALHLAWGGLGMYCLLRTEGLGRPAALLGGLAFEALPKLFAHYGAGHLSLLYAVPWTPWLIREAARTHGGEPGFWTAAFNWKPPVVFALIILADVRWGAYAGALWWVYWLAHSYPIRVALRRNHVATGNPSQPGDLPPTGRRGFSLAPLLTLTVQTALGLLLAAPLLAPLLEYTRLTTRAHLTSAEILAYSLPAARLLGLVFPDFGGYHETMLYSGSLVLALALLALAWRGGTQDTPALRRVPFWLLVAGAALLVALAASLPFVAPLARLPGLSLLRAPSRALFVLGMALAVLAAASVERILGGVRPGEKRRAGLFLVGLAGFALALAGGVFVLLRQLPAGFAWGAAFSLAAAVWLGLGLSGRLSGRAWYAVLLALCLLDWGVVDHSLFVFRSQASVLAEGEAAARYLAVQPGLFRVYSPSYSLPQQTAVRYGLQLTDGVDPLQLQSYAAFMAQASGVPSQGYSVTLPPFGAADPAQANAAYSPDPLRLGLLNVSYVAAQFDLHVDGLVPLARFGETRLYQNQFALPRAWVQPFEAAPGRQAAPAEIVAWAPDRIELNAAWPAGAAPGVLVLSELAYPGWQVRLDGRPAELLTVAGLLRGVRLPPGKHQVVFEFHPGSVSIGLALGALGLAILLALQAFRFRLAAQQRAAAPRGPLPESLP